MPLHIETFRSSKTPWEVFQAVHSAAEACFFLDTPAYVPPDQVYSYIGLDPILEIRLEGGRLIVEGESKGRYPASELFSVSRKILKKYSRLSLKAPFFTGGFAGFLGYGIASLCDKVRFRSRGIPASPEMYLGLFLDMIVYDHQKKIYHLVSRSSGHEKMKRFFCAPANEPGNFRLTRFRAAMSKERFKGIVGRAKEYIAAGDIYQANLSQRFDIGFRGSALALYGRLREINPSPFSSFFKVRDLQIVSSSPERLIRKKGSHCETRPIAGTCPAYGSKKRPGEWRKKLLENPKERAEHLMLVDLERNDLGRVCDYSSVKVEEFMMLEKYSHVVHIVSKITGRLCKGKDAFDLVRAMFPGGTITGCPKIRCMEIIDQLEPVPRGIYTGSLGYIDLRGDMDLNIVIRTLVLEKNRGHLQVGAGIVWDSDPEKEYEETLHKGEALVRALTGRNP